MRFTIKKKIYWKKKPFLNQEKNYWKKKPKPNVASEKENIWPFKEGQPAKTAGANWMILLTADANANYGYWSVMKHIAPRMINIRYLSVFLVIITMHIH